MSALKPMVVWQHGLWRIVAIPPDDDGPGVCITEMNARDTLGNDSWREVIEDEVSEIARGAIITLVEEVVLKLDMLPLWVRKFMTEQRQHNDSHECGHDDGDVA